MAFIGLRGGKTKFNWHREGLRKLIGEAAAKSLQRAGLEVRKSTQRGIVGGSTRSGRRPSSRPKLWRVGQHDGFDAVAIVNKVPRTDRVSSWAPQAFLRNDIQSDWDNRTQSVVVGPSKAPWLNQLHEFGGAMSYYLNPIRPYPIGGWIGPNLRLPKKWERARFRRDNRGRFTRKDVGAYVGYLTTQPRANSIYVGSRSIRGRAYMEFGLQASINKIPPQFRNSIRRSGGSI